MADTCPVFTDKQEWTWGGIGDEILHIELVKWADVCLFAPLSANTLAKLAMGLCDNLVTCVARAWHFSKPILVAPAMNTRMWKHPVTNVHLDALASLSYQIVPPISKKLACGDEGVGAMAEVTTLVDALLATIAPTRFSGPP